MFKGAWLAAAWVNWCGLCWWWFFFSFSLSSWSISCQWTTLRMFDLLWLLCRLKAFSTAGIYHSNLKNTAVGCLVLYRLRKEQKSLLNSQVSCMLNQCHSLRMWGNLLGTHSFYIGRGFPAPLPSSPPSPCFSWCGCPRCLFNWPP